MHQNGVPVGICAAGTPFLFVSNLNHVNVPEYVPSAGQIDSAGFNVSSNTV